MVQKPLKVLFAIHPFMDILDFAGPLEAICHATFTPLVGSPNQNTAITRHISMEEAYTTLASYDILVIPGGGSPGVLEGQTEPLNLIKAFAALEKKVDGGIRTLISICTGSLFLGEVGALDGLKATTHVEDYARLRNICKARGETEIVGERFVVNTVNEKNYLRVITAGGCSCGIDAT